MPRLVAGPPSQTAPSTYKLAPSEAFIPESVTATFDGTGAGGTFLPTLSIYSQDGKLIARSPATQITAGNSAEVTFAPLLRAAAAAAAATALPFASIEGNEFINVPSGVTVANSFGAGPGIQTNDSATFTVDLNSVGPLTPYYGLGIHADGLYFLFWSGLVVDQPGFRVANPSTVNVNIDDGGSGTTYIPTGLVLGSTAALGLNPYYDAATAYWTVSWAKTAVIKGDTGTVPIVSQVHHTAGVTLLTQFANVLAIKLSDSTFGF